MICPIDGIEMNLSFMAQILGKYDATYHVCPGCSLIQPENPHWLNEAYSSAIAATDIGLIQRNRSNSDRLEPILFRLQKPEAKILDVGGGYGILCRALRDKGFDCYTTDVYCQNMFAKDFEPASGFKADVLMAFEVLEHISDPLSFIRESFEKYGGNTLIFSTLTYSGDRVPSPDWWYYTFETGQHISLYNAKTLKVMAAKLGLHCQSLSPDLHIFSKAPVSALDVCLLHRERKILHRLFKAYVRLKRRHVTLLGQDYRKAREAILTNSHGKSQLASKKS